MRPKSHWGRRVLAGALAGAFCFAAEHLCAAEWKVDLVDQSGSGKYTSLKVDANGDAHLAYVPDADGHPLKYAFWDHRLDRWFTMNVAPNAQFCTLVLDSRQRPHISYVDFGTCRGCKLRYARWDGTEWKTDPVSPKSEAIVSFYTSIGLNAEDKPVFSYYDYLGADGAQTIRLRSVFWEGSYWGVQVVDPAQGSGKFNSLALDSKGHPHIAYANVKYESMGLRYASYNGETWTREILEGIKGPYAIYSVALVLDKTDTPHITYTDVARRVVKYATRRNGKWLLSDVESIRGIGFPDRNGIVVDEHGRVYISYYDSAAGNLRVATLKDGKWYAETVASEYAGFTSSLEIHDDTLWVAFADEGSGGVRVARRPLGGVSSPSASIPSGKEKLSMK